MLCFFFLTLLPTLVLGGSKLNFTISPVVQCEPITVNFSSNVAEINGPMTLTILPLTSVPVIIPIPSLALNSSGLAITFLPLQAGQDFIASLDDPVGNSLARVSDLTRVLASPTGNRSCLPQEESLVNNDHFRLVSPPNQCEEIAVSYKSEIGRGAPTVRAYMPKHSSGLLPQTSDNSSSGTATYIVNVQHGEQVLLSFDDGMQNRETSGLITVGGDASSPVDCISKYPAGKNTTVAASKQTDGPDMPTPISREVIIGCSVGGGIILVIIIAMVIFVVRDRKSRRRRRTITSFYTKQVVQNGPPPKEGTASNPFEESPMFESGEGGNPDEGYISNPPYVMGELDHPADDGKRPPARSSFSSWAHQESVADGETSFHRRPSVDPVQTLDIEGMLNMATALSGTQGSKQAVVANDTDPISHSPRRHDTLSTPLEMPTVITDLSRVRHWHAPSDVPADMTGSGSISAYSLLMSNPFNDNGTIVLPSPFNRADEPARPASDVVRPMSRDRIGVNDTPLSSGGHVVLEPGAEKRSSVIEYREGT